MSFNGGVNRIYDILFREFSHRSDTGLFPIGKPKKNSPVLLTGNYTETIRRVKKALRGKNVWLLIANSKGINVWCAAGGGHLTHHDVISAIVTSGVDDKLTTRELILPQLGATGIERQKVTDATGWKTIWGPARVEDMPVFLEQKHLATPQQRYMRFPLWERMEMATLWGIPMIVIGFLIFGLIGGLLTGISVGISAAIISYGTFALLPWLNVKGWKRWPTFLIFGTAGLAAGVLFLQFLDSFGARSFLLLFVGTIIETLAFSVDFAGTTPWYGSYINTFGNHAYIDLVSDRCDGSADCIQVCPRNVFKMNGTKHKVDLVSPEDCIECGACIVQCPRDALRFRYDNGSVVEAFTIRRTRMNMLGKRTVMVVDESKPPSKEESQ